MDSFIVFNLIRTEISDGVFISFWCAKLLLFNIHNYTCVNQKSISSVRIFICINNGEKSLEFYNFSMATFYTCGKFLFNSLWCLSKEHIKNCLYIDESNRKFIWASALIEKTMSKFLLSKNATITHSNLHSVPTFQHFSLRSYTLNRFCCRHFGGTIWIAWKHMRNTIKNKSVG